MISWGESCGDSFGWVWSQPSGSISSRNSCFGNWFGSVTCACVPHCGTNAIHLISFTYKIFVSPGFFYLAKFFQLKILIYLWVIRWWNTIHIASNLWSQIRNANELFENILGQDISVASLFDIIRWYINVICSKMKIRCGNCTDSPFCFRGKCISLIVWCRCCYLERKTIIFYSIFFNH